MPNGGAGEHMLDGILRTAAGNLEQPSQNGSVCPDHDNLRQGVYALVLCEQERRFDNAKTKKEKDPEPVNWFSFSKKDGIRAAGVPAIILGAILAMLLFQYMHSQKIEAIAKKVAEETVTKVIKP